MAPTVPNTMACGLAPPTAPSTRVCVAAVARCSNQARAEGVNLVSINDEVEQEWLVEQFGFLPYWIGLVYSNKSGMWEWSSGELVDYTNWAKSQSERMEVEVTVS